MQAESEINLRLYVSRDIRLRIGSGIWLDRKRRGKKNDINIPIIQGEEREQLLEKRAKLKALTDILEQEINTSTDKTLSENRLKNFRVLIRCLHRFDLYKKKSGGRGFTLSFANLTPELLRQIEDFLFDEKSVFLQYP